MPSLCIAVQGVKEVLFGGKAYRYHPDNSLVVSVELPVISRVVEASSDAPCLAVVVAFDSAVVGELLADHAIAPPPGPPVPALGVAPVGQQLLDAVNRLAALLDAPQDIDPLAPLVLREITYRVLTGPHGSRLRQVAAVDAPAQRIVRAIRWLKEHFAEPLWVETLARQVRMSPSAFHMHFKAVTAHSPLQYQKRLRLQEARRLMIGEGLDAAQAGFRVGYESPSQFSREYRRLFGASPRRNVAALTAEAHPVHVSGRQRRGALAGS
jgi:AraC-like DNA-binding protein